MEPQNRSPPPTSGYGRAPICLQRKHDHYIGVCIGYASGMDLGTDQVITLSVKRGEGGFGIRPYVD